MQWGLFSMALLLSTASLAGDPHRAAAEKLVDELFTEQSWDSFLDQSIDQQMQGNPTMAQFMEPMRTFMKKYMGWDAMRPEFVTIYAGAFTTPELKQLAKFYGTPTGHKAAELLPQLMEQGAEVGRRKVSEHQAELMQLILGSGIMDPGGVHAPEGPVAPGPRAQEQ
jgi:hypothetical protein